MRRILQETEQIERFLTRRLSTEDQAAFQVRLLTEPDLKEQVEQQQEAYRLIRTYGRRRLRRELADLHRKMMARPSFRRRILAIFRLS